MHEGSSGPCCACAQQGRRTRPASQRPARAPLTSTVRPRGLVFVLRVSEDQAHSSLKSQSPHHSHPAAHCYSHPFPLLSPHAHLLSPPPHPPPPTFRSSLSPLVSMLHLCSLFPGPHQPGPLTGSQSPIPYHPRPSPTSAPQLSSLSLACVLCRDIFFIPHPFSSPAVCRTGTRHL